MATNSVAISKDLEAISFWQGAVVVLGRFFFALIFTSTIAAKTVPVAIAEFTGRYVVDISGMMSGGVLAAIPPVVLALVFQRYIVRGLTAGAVKG